MRLPWLSGWVTIAAGFRWMLTAFWLTGVMCCFFVCVCVTDRWAGWLLHPARPPALGGPSHGSQPLHQSHGGDPRALHLLHQGDWLTGDVCLKLFYGYLLDRSLKKFQWSLRKFLWFLRTPKDSLKRFYRPLKRSQGSLWKFHGSWNRFILSMRWINRSLKSFHWLLRGSRSSQICFMKRFQGSFHGFFDGVQESLRKFKWCLGRLHRSLKTSKAPCIGTRRH